MGDYLSRVWRCRYFWLSLVKKDLRARYQSTVLGLGWSLVRPVAMAIVLCMVFHRIFKVDPRHYAPYLLLGLACWHYIVQAAMQGCKCFFQGGPYIRQYPAPLAIYPLRVALGTTVHFLLALGLAVSLALGLNGLSNLPALVSLVPSILLLFIFCWSLAVLAGMANVFFRDTVHLCELGFQILFYATPVMYPRQIMRYCQLEWLNTYNPVVPFLTLLREPVLEGQVPLPATWGAAVMLTIVAATAAGLTLARLQRRLVFYL